MTTFGKNKRLVMTAEGFSLIEILLLIVVIGIAASTALQWMTASIDDIRTVNTEREMEMLAEAISGDPAKLSNGKRSDFGYIGDIGAFPANLQALYENPGGYATWDGPYIAKGFSQDSTGFKFDEWGVAYNYGGGITISSTGGGTTISKKIADASNDYLLNSFIGVIRDSAGNVPGTTYLDSVDVVVAIPNGTGGTSSKTYSPDSAGTFMLDSLPVGHHSLRIIYTPNVDTIFRYLTILPRHKSNPIGEYYYSSALFDSSGGGGGGSGAIEYVPGTVDFKSGKCEEVMFDIINTSGGDITLTNMKVSWSTPNTWYDEIRFDGPRVWDEDSPCNATGDVATFSSAQVISSGETITVIIKDFEDQDDGDGNDVDMNNITFTIEFSDGSSFDVTTGACP